jgi:hypothetical protein
VGEAFRNYPLNYFFILKKSEFEKLKLTFESKEDPFTKKPLSLTVDTNEFKMIDGDCLFKLAARALIEESTSNNSDIALKY